ncbi:MAG: thioredoxin family protein, partial [Burkholderiales bacterium]
WVRVASSADLDQRLRSPGRPVMLDFYADWCVSCKEMEAFTFSDPKVQAALAGMTLLQVDVTANSLADRDLLKRFRLFGPPGIVFFDASGREIPGLRVIGFQGADRFLETLALAQKL